MPTIVAQDDVIIRTAQVILDQTSILNAIPPLPTTTMSTSRNSTTGWRVSGRCRTYFRLN